MHSILTNGKPPNKREILRLVKERDVRYIRMAFVDILGISKNVMIPATELERSIRGRRADIRRHA